MIRARGKSVSGNMGQSSILTGRVAAQCSQKGSRIFLDKIDPENGDISPISAAAQVFTKPSVLLNSLRRLFDVFQQIPRLTVQQSTKPLYVLPGQPLALPQLLKRGLT